MGKKARAVLDRTARVAVLSLVVALLLGAGAAPAANQFLNDGAKQNAVTGAWVLPNQGTCYPVEGASIAKRPECVATIFNATYATSAACAAAFPTGVSNTWSATTNVCLDAVNNTQALCIDSAASASFPAGIDRKWSGGVCLLTMKGYDRNKVVCKNQGGTYGPVGTVVPALSGGACFGSWVMPDASTFTPPLLNRTGVNPSTGDQCLRCHRSDTEWNNNRVRDVETMIMTGHKNMSRKVTVGTPQLGPSGAAYPTDSSGNLFDWTNGTITVGGVASSLLWVYDGWFEDPHRPAAIYKAAASATKVCSDPRGTAANCVSTYGGTLINNAGAAYSCGRCHTTGWTSDATIGPSTGNLAKEPEKSFPGVTWDRNSNAPANVVNLSGGVTGDTNKYSSWDLFGITCTKCHGSVVDNASNGGVAPMTAPAGFGSHNNSFTGFDAGSGYCTVAGPTNAVTCAAAAGTWLTACSNGLYTTQATCVAHGATWSFPSCSTNDPSSTVGTVNGVKQAYCSIPTTAYATKAACTATVGGAWVNIASYATQNECTAAGFTWDSTKLSCSSTSQAQCLAVNASFVWDGSGSPAANTCNVCFVPDATKTTPAACAATAGLAVTGTTGATWTNAYASDPDSCKAAAGKYTGTKIQRGQVITAVCTNCHRQEAGGLPYGNAAIPGNTDPDSPGTVLKVGPYHNTVTFPSHFHGNQFLNSPHAKFTGTFAQIATGAFNYSMTGEYKSYFLSDGEAANTGNGCTGCHDVHKSTYEKANPAGGAVKECTECHAGTYAKDLTKMHHPAGAGTPLELMATEPAEPCIKCHMPGGQHLFRINSDPTYSTFPPQAFTNGVTGTVQPANTQPDGTFTKAVWVDVNAACGQCHGGGTAHAKTTGTIAIGAPTILTVANASGFAPGEAVTIAGAGTLAGQPVDLPTYVTSVAGNVVTLVGKASFGVTNAAVVLNPTRKRADNSDIIFFNKQSLAYYAKGIHGDAAPAVDAPPVAAGSCNFTAATWAATCSSTSTDDKGIQKTIVDWGDGTMLSTAAPFAHTYLLPGTYTIKLKVIDTIGQQTSATIGSVASAAFGYFSVSGRVLNGTTPIGGAQVHVYKGSVLVKSLMSAADGSYSTGTLRPGTFTVTAFKAGFIFASPALTVTIGPSAVNQDLVATGTSLTIREGLTNFAAPRPHN